MASLRSPGAQAIHQESMGESVSYCRASIVQDWHLSWWHGIMEISDVRLTSSSPWNAPLTVFPSALRDYDFKSHLKCFAQLSWQLSLDKQNPPPSVGVDIRTALTWFQQFMFCGCSLNPAQYKFQSKFVNHWMQSHGGWVKLGDFFWWHFVAIKLWSDLSWLYMRAFASCLSSYCHWGGN